VTDFDKDVRTATEALREMLAMAGVNDPDALLPLFRARWEYGVVWDPGKPDGIHECDDQDHAREWKRDLHWEGPLVRRLVVRHVGQWNPIPAQKEKQ
jgi:hypothetical protein